MVEVWIEAAVVGGYSLIILKTVEYLMTHFLIRGL